MYKKIIFSLLAIFTITFLGIQLQANGFVKYIMFAGEQLVDHTDQLVLLGDTSIKSDGIYLIDDVDQTSGLYLNDQIVLSDSGINRGFSLNYSFTVYKNSINFGEGLAFVFSTNYPTLGEGGSSYGIGGINNTIAFDIDFFSQDNDFGSPHLGVNPIIDGFFQTTSTGVGLELELIDIYDNALKGNRVFDLFVWLDYNAQTRMMSIYVSKNLTKPTLPVQYFISEDFAQLDMPVYPGVTSSSTSNVMDIKVNSMFVDDRYNTSSLDSTYYDYQSDNIAPSVPEVNTIRSSNDLTFIFGNSVDDLSGVRGYEYSLNQIDWIQANSIRISQATDLYIRAFDNADNRSEILHFEIIAITFDTQEVGSVYTQYFYIGESYEIPIGQRSADYIITSWTLQNGSIVNDINELATSQTLLGVAQKHTYTITYDSGLGTQEGNPSVHSILDEDVPLLPAKRSGYAFTGWYANGELIEVLGPNILDNIHLVATYEPLSLIYVIYGFDNRIQTLTLESDSRIGSFRAIYLPQGYEFVGLYTEPFGQGERITETTRINDVETFNIFPYIRRITEETSTSTQLNVALFEETSNVTSHTFIYAFLPLIFIPFIILIKRGQKHE